MQNAMPSPFSPEPPVCFISPHLDDAVWSCGHYLAANSGATVVTVFTGAPKATQPRGYNEATTGAATAREAFEIRKAEDRNALSELDATWVHLDLLEMQWAGDQDLPTVASAIRAGVRVVAPRSIVVPIGIQHPDHVAVCDAWISLLDEFPELDWYVYAEVPYSSQFPQELDDRRSTFPSRGITLTQLSTAPSATDAKTIASQMYTTQWAAYVNDHVDLESAIREPERYWRARG
jgi:LmbE family N-acetylglucosaminyl deacetylase